jgi:hypothetical protein
LIKDISAREFKDIREMAQQRIAKSGKEFSLSKIYDNISKSILNIDVEVIREDLELRSIYQ